MELNITEEIDCDNLFDQVDGFMDYPVDDNESGGGVGDGDGKLVQSIEGQEFLTLNDASTNYDPFLSSVHFNSASSLSDELSVPYEDILQLEWLSTFVEDSFSSIGLTLGKDTKKDQFQTSSPLSVLESSTTSSSSSRKAMPSLGPQRARTKRPRPAAFNPFRVFPSEPISITESPPIKKKIKKKRMGDEYKKKKIEMTFAPFDGSLVQKCLHCGITKTPQWRGGPLGPKTLCNACGVRYKSGRLFPEYRPAASPSFVPSLHSNSHKKVVEIRSKVGHGDAGGAR